MNPQDIEEWKQDYDNAQGWANEENLNQRRRDEGKKMAYDQKDNEVTLWQQEKKSEKSPSYSGKGLVNGKEVRAALWNNTDKNGKTYLKVKFEEPRDQGATPAPASDPDIPF
tara:strand:+ start:180 stop:515 length:336 start_codon:yes stop_codon:yes gene_type:complete